MFRDDAIIQMMDNFADGLAHDLNNIFLPIATITEVVTGCAALMVAPGASAKRDEFFVGREKLQALDGIASFDLLGEIDGFDAVALWAGCETVRRCRISLSGRDGRIIPLLAEAGDSYGYTVERHICIDTTAAGGNASLLAGVEEDESATS